MLRRVLKGLLLAVALSALGAMYSDRGLEAKVATCLVCTGPQCWCEVKLGQFCDGIDPDMTCKCNAE